MSDFPVSTELVYDFLSLLTNNMLIPVLLTTGVTLFLVFLRDRKVMTIQNIYPYVLGANIIIWFFIFVIFPEIREVIQFPLIDYDSLIR